MIIDKQDNLEFPVKCYSCLENGFDTALKVFASKKNYFPEC